MRNPRQQFFPAYLLALHQFHRGLQPFCHLIESGANGAELILLLVHDAVVQIPVTNLTHAGCQKFQRLLNFSKHKPCQKTVGQKNRQKNGKQNQQRRKRQGRFPVERTCLRGAAQQADEVFCPVYLFRVSKQGAPVLHQRHLAAQLLCCLQQSAVILALRPAAENFCSLRQYGQRHAVALQKRLHSVKRISLLQLVFYRLGNGHGSIGEIFYIVGAKPCAAQQRGPNQAQADKPRQHGRQHGDEDHQKVGPEQAPFYGHVPHLPFGLIIAHAAVGNLNYF